MVPGNTPAPNPKTHHHPHPHLQPPPPTPGPPLREGKALAKAHFSGLNGTIVSPMVPNLDWEEEDGDTLGDDEEQPEERLRGGRKEKHYRASWGGRGVYVRLG